MAIFQSTLPGWGATRRHAPNPPRPGYFNPRSPDGERRACSCSPFPPPRISIHAPRMGSDAQTELKDTMADIFQSTLPGWGATAAAAAEVAQWALFQSTLPGWGATVPDTAGTLEYAISIHAPRMGSDHVKRHHSSQILISIHAPRMGSDLTNNGAQVRFRRFQSTLPGWGATAKMDIFAHDMGKIIHFQH